MQGDNILCENGLYLFTGGCRDRLALFSKAVKLDHGDGLEGECCNLLVRLFTQNVIRFFLSFEIANVRLGCDRE